MFSLEALQENRLQNYKKTLNHNKIMLDKYVLKHIYFIQKDMGLLRILL